MVYVGAITAGPLIYRRSRIKTVGGYLVDVRIHTYREDMIRDAAKDGVELVYSAYAQYHRRA